MDNLYFASSLLVEIGVWCCLVSTLYLLFHSPKLESSKNVDPSFKALFGSVILVAQIGLVALIVGELASVLLFLLHHGGDVMYPYLYAIRASLLGTVIVLGVLLVFTKTPKRLLYSLLLITWFLYLGLLVYSTHLALIQAQFIALGYVVALLLVSMVWFLISKKPLK